MKKRVGDTLIEVALAIGIFSMVAITIVAIMTGGTSNAETALETTLAREEIDTQAEALRFIHASYIADVDSENEQFANLWSNIISHAIDPGTFSEYLEYAPKTCKEVTESNTLKNYGFVINPKILYSDPDNAYIRYNSTTFKTTSTYPRLIYSADEASGSDSLIASSGDSLYRAEGIYVIAVKDKNSTQVIDDGTQAEYGTGFYDFYIRTCWYGMDTETPSTISTVVRLYNPPEVTERDKARVTIVYNNNGGPRVPITYQRVLPGGTAIIARYEDNASFVGWNTKADLTGGTISWDESTGRCTAIGISNITTNASGQCVYTAPNPLSSSITLTLYAMWNERITVTLTWQNDESNDLDSYVKGTRTDGHTFEAYYGQMQGSFISGQPAIASLDRDCTGTCRKEVFTINTLGGDKYYYYVKNYSNQTANITKASVLVETSSTSTTFNASNAVGNGATWNVFAYIDDTIIPCETRSGYNEPNTSYTEPCGRFTISYDGNGSTSGGMSPHSIAFGEATTLRTNTFTRDEYNFIGWNTRADGSGTSYNDGASYTAPSAASGSTSVTFYAQWEPAAPPKIYLQDLTNEQCSTLASSESIVAYDRRDESDYTVRYINGKCWMTQNLRITGTITAADSNFTGSSISLTSSTLRTYNYQNVLAYAISNNNDYGVWYNQCAATAGQLCGYYYYDYYNSYRNYHDNGSPDICPAHWQIPSYDHYLVLSDSRYINRRFEDVIGYVFNTSYNIYGNYSTFNPVSSGLNYNGRSYGNSYGWVGHAKPPESYYDYYYYYNYYYYYPFYFMIRNSIGTFWNDTNYYGWGASIRCVRQ